MSRSFLETIFLGGGIAGAVFDIAAGPANTAIINTLLSAGDGDLTADTPLFLRSTGALGAPRALTLDDAEDDGPRIIFIDFFNTDIAVNNILVSGSVSINGAAVITVSEVSQWILFHVGGGIWYALRQWPQNTVEGAAIRRLTFASALWAAGTVNQITITQSAAPGAGEIGPHGLDLSDTYVVQVYDTDGAVSELVGVDTEVDPATGNITLFIAGPGQAFGGTVVIIGDT